MKEHEYKQNLPHGMNLSVYIEAKNYGIVDEWTAENGVFEDLPPTLEIAGLLNAKGLALLEKARSKGWDHRNFYYYKRLGINWFGIEALKTLIKFTGITEVEKSNDFVMPEISSLYKKPTRSVPQIYQPIQRLSTRLLGSKYRGRGTRYWNVPKKISSIWDNSTKIDYDFSMFNWGYFPEHIPSFLTYKNIADAMFGSSKVTKYESPLEVLEALSKTDLHQSETIQTEFYNQELKNTFTDLIVKHGLFIGKWYPTFFSRKLVRSLGTLRQRADVLESLFNRAYGYSTVSKSDLGTFNKIAGHIFWQMVYHSVFEGSIKFRIQDWIDRFSEPKNCVRCDKLFSPILTDPEYYFGSNANILMCFDCMEPEEPDLKDLNKLINNFVEACGFPPPDGVTPIDWRVNTKISHKQQVKVVDAWSSMGGIHYVKNSLDMSWFRAMYEAGSLPDGTVPSGLGIKCMAIDGHECGSLDEKTIDDFLTKNGIKHNKEPLYPYHAVLNPNTKKRGDWKIGDKIIEYFGLEGNIAYDERTKEKIQLAAETGIDLIGVYPDEVFDLDITLLKNL